MIGGETKFEKVVEVLRDMHRQRIIGSYAIGGAVAASLYYEPISTVDLDIFFVFEPPQKGLILSMEPIYNYVRGHGYEFDKDFIYIDRWPVQFIESSHDPLWIDGLENARSFKVGNAEVKVIPPEHLVIMWAQAGRKKDFAKIDSFEEAGLMDATILRNLLEQFNRLEQWRSIQGRLSNEYKF